MVAKTRPFNTWDVVKLLALLLMFIDHAGAFFLTSDDYKWLRAIGRGAAPIFLFLAGFASSYRFQRDLFGLAMLMSVSDFLLVGHLRTQNILVTILISRLILQWIDRKGEPIKHPYQWLFGSMAWLATMILTVYGSFGVMFALCGYVKRRTDYYSKEIQERMLIITLFTFGLVAASTFQFAYWDTFIMTLVLIGVYYLLNSMDLHVVDTDTYPPSILRIGKTISIYSGYIYALHLIALEWITGIPF